MPTRATTSSARTSSAEFDEKHDLSLLGGAFLRRVPARRYAELKDEINDISILWRNNHRYCYGKERDMLKANAIRVIEVASKVLEYGEMKWRV